MITPLQRAAARAFFTLPESAGFAVAGGAALIARDGVDRQTRDVDVFAPAPPAAPIPQVVAAYERSLAAHGWATRRIHVSDAFARLVVEAEGGSLVVDIGLDGPPGQPPTMTELGPTLSAHDLAARKTLALFGRAEARDFTDVYALAHHFGKEQLLRWAAAQDGGFDLRVFADMIGTMRRFTDEDLRLAHPTPAAYAPSSRPGGRRFWRAGRPHQHRLPPPLVATESDGGQAVSRVRRPLGTPTCRNVGCSG